MERVGFTMRLLPGQEAEYRRRHAAVWPEMLDALKAAGCRDYSIFLRRRSDLFAYLEVDDFAAFRAAMAASPVNDRWQAEMAALIDPLTDPATGLPPAARGDLPPRLSGVDHVRKGTGIGDRGHRRRRQASIEVASSSSPRRRSGSAPCQRLSVRKPWIVGEAPGGQRVLGAEARRRSAINLQRLEASVGLAVLDLIVVGTNLSACSDEADPWRTSR